MLIAITGYSGCGKDTVADYLVKYHGFTKKTFAEPLKKAVQLLFDFSDHQVYGTQEDKMQVDPRWCVTPRGMMQWLGTDIIRNQFDPDFWVKHFEFTFKHDALIVVSDLRFMNEASLIHKLGGLIVRLHRHDNHDEHQSETELDYIIPDMIINNNQSVDDLYQHVDAIINRHHKKVV